MAERLQKIMAQAGVASRRSSEKLIINGCVTVNGKTTTKLGTRVNPDDKIEVNGKPIECSEKLVYYLLNKPRNVLTTVSDEKGRMTVIDVLNEVKERIYPVGRLDYDTTGALLLTNDGELANKLMHPRYKIDKVYLAKVKGIPTNDELKTLRLGVKIAGKKTAEARANIIRTDSKKGTSTIQLTIHEGRYHQIKEMLKIVGHPVIKLHRERYGMLEVSDLLSGEYRTLRYNEIQYLKNGRQIRKSSGRL